MNSLGLADFIGLVGVGAYIVAYCSVQLLHHPATSRSVTALNLVGPVCVLISLIESFNLASFVSQCLWLLLTVAGWWRRRRRPAPRDLAH